MGDETIVETSVEQVDCRLASPFRIARGETVTVTNHLVRVTDAAGRTGIGGAAPSSYYGENPASVAATLPDLLGQIESAHPTELCDGLDAELAERAPTQAAARAAVSVAVHDLAATQRDEPLYERWNLDPETAPRSSVTVGLDDSEAMAAEATRWREAGYPVLKVKLGGDAEVDATNEDERTGFETDRARLRAVREAAPDVRLRVDVNGGWTETQARAGTSWLEAAEVELLEQPVPATALDELRRVSESTSIPVAADESCVTADDVPAIADAADSVVVKLMKCGGIEPARRQLAVAREHGLDPMIGCMVETSASIAGACHLSPLATYADLDGALLLDDDPCRGPLLAEGRIELDSASRGTGVDCS